MGVLGGLHVAEGEWIDVIGRPPAWGGCVPLNSTLHMAARAHVFTVVGVVGKSLYFLLLYDENCMIWT